jgi:anaerobic magnesium-protoporphyrin IX monomethyl ester cyclase
MTVLLLSGEGPSFRYWRDLDGSLFDHSGEPPQRWPQDVRLAGFRYRTSVGGTGPLLRKKVGKVNYLVSYTLESILYHNGIDYEPFPLRDVWSGEREPETRRPEAVLLSTSFICNKPTLRRAVTWIRERFPDVPLIAGGQFTNVKFTEVMRDFSEIDYVVRGDGEESIPAVVAMVRGRQQPGQVPNLVYREGGSLRVNPLQYIDLDAHPAPSFPGRQRIIPYESMRGCPFSCRFCSYPAASPQWRYKSTSKIVKDWTAYAEGNSVDHIQALDSTFTVPKPRLRELLPQLVTAPLTWEAYTRANALHSEEIVDSLEAAHCTKLSIGFESMSPATLGYMHKQVRAEQNRKAHALLRDRSIQYRVSYMVGYPGETPDDFAMTAGFLRDEFVGYFMLSVFSFTDQTMPVWQDAERFSLQIHDPDDPDRGWEHVGMDVDTAHSLRDECVRRVRWGSETAVWLLWQAHYETPLVPADRDRRRALRLEKLVERLAMLPVDITDPAQRRSTGLRLLREMYADHAVVLHDRADRPMSLSDIESAWSTC